MSIATSTPTFVTEGLDRVEASLPPIPAKVLRLQRTAAGAAYDQFVAVVDTMFAATRNVLDTARVSGKTVTGQARAASTDVVGTARNGGKAVVGQARAAGGDVARSARTGARTVAGQAEAQGERVARAASTQAGQVLDAAVDAIDDTPGRGTPYEQWTRTELLQRARELDIPGRSGLSKQQLIDALRAH